MDTNNISELKPRVQKFEYEHLGTKTTLSYDERYLYEEWNGLAKKGKNTYLLYRLSPNIVESTDINHDAVKQVRTSWILLVAAIVIYFSNYNSEIPLLAPALALFGALFFLVNVKKAWPRVCAIVYDDYNYKQVSIPIYEKEDISKSEREGFLKELSNAIEEAKKQEFYGDK